MTDIQETARYTLAKIKETGADMGTCTVTSGKSTEVYYESGKIGMVRTVFSGGVNISVITQNRTGTATINNTDRDQIDAAVADAFAAAQSATPDDGAGIAELEENKTFSAGDETPDRELLYNALNDLLTDTKREYPKISYDSISAKHRWVSSCLANTNGVELVESIGHSSVDTMFMGRDGEKVSSFNGFGMPIQPDKRVIDCEPARRVLADTEASIETVPVQGKFVGTILMPPAFFEEVINETADLFLSDGCIVDGTSPWKDKIGEQVASPLLNVTAKPWCPELPFASYFCSDGYVAEETPVIREGKLLTFMLSRYGAKKTGLSRCRGWDSSLSVTPGSAKLADMIAGIQRGILVNRFSGGAPSANGDFTGVAKNSFLIENGKITVPLSETMISGNYASLLKSVDAVSEEYYTNGESIQPWVRATGITVSGKGEASAEEA